MRTMAAARSPHRRATGGPHAQGHRVSALITEAMIGQEASHLGAPAGDVSM